MALINDIGNRDMAPNINGKEIITDYGSAVIVEYDQSKEKFLVEYTGHDQCTQQETFPLTDHTQRLQQSRNQ